MIAFLHKILQNLCTYNTGWHFSSTTDL